MCIISLFTYLTQLKLLLYNLLQSMLTEKNTLTLEEKRATCTINCNLKDNKTLLFEKSIHNVNVINLL